MPIAEVINVKFSGHESFHCRPFWLKKGYDFVKKKQPFNDEAGIELGVGRNMVGSIRFWLKAFNIVDEQENPTILAEKIFENSGWDPFLEDEATLWLLHYKLAATKFSSIYHLIFNELRKIKPEFSKFHLFSKIRELDYKHTEGIIVKDFSVFVRSYLANDKEDKEESFSGLFNELGLLTELAEDAQKNQLYHISNANYQRIPWQILLYCIVENPNYGNSISLKSMFSDENGVGNLMVLTPENLEKKLIEISNNSPEIVYKNDAGVKELQFKNTKPDGLEILKSYYES